jgi:hypothetical protein
MAVFMLMGDILSFLTVFYKRVKMPLALVDLCPIKVLVVQVGG